MKPKYSKKELEWATTEGAKVGITDPLIFLNMRWSELNKLLAEHNLNLHIYPEAPTNKELKSEIPRRCDKCPPNKKDNKTYYKRSPKKSKKKEHK